MSGLSVVIITFQEAGVIRRCIESVQGLADEVLVMDSGSTDNTVAICTSLGARVMHQPWLGFAAQKNKANSFAQFDWILSLDADEALSPELYQSILAEKQRGFLGAYKMKRLSTYFGKPLRRGLVYPDTQRRLFNRTEVSWKNSLVHEVPDIPSAIAQRWLEGDLWHTGPATPEEHRTTLRKYATLWASDRAASGKRSFWGEALLKSSFNFVWGYFVKGAVLDGRIGWIVSCNLAGYTFSKYHKLYQLKSSK